MASIPGAWRRLAAGAGVIALGAHMSTCSSPEPAPPPHASGLWGDLKAVVSVKELMKYMIDPVADNIFNAVGSVMTKNGIEERQPKSDEDWDRIQVGAVSLAEGAYLLKVPRPFAPPGDLNNSTGPNAVELSPAQILAKVQRDPVEWNARIETLRNASLAVMDIVRKRDVNGLWDAGEILDQACEACHRSYWYPGEDAAFYRNLRRRLEQSRIGSQPETSGAPKK